MLKTALTDLLGIKHPIIQAGMGPFSNNQLSIATTNAGVLGLISTSGLDGDEKNPGNVYKYFVKTGGASLEDDKATVLAKTLKQTCDKSKGSGGIFGINVMVSAEQLDFADFIISNAIKARDEDPDMKDRFRVIFTSAGDPSGWGDKIKGAGFKWIHIVPSVKTALRCKKAGVDVVVASGHEGGMHTHWEPIHSMILLPAVVEALAGSGIPVVGAGGFCDGKTLAAALALGASGVQMGTRFLATAESDFAPVWKEGIVKAGDRGTLVARGFVGPARWIKTPKTLKHQEETLKLSPGVFLGRPDDSESEGAKQLMQNESAGFEAAFRGDAENSMFAGGECAQRIDSLPLVQELVDGIVKESTEIIGGLPTRVIAN